MFFKYTVGTATEAKIAKKQAGRTSLVVYNNHATATIYIGSGGQGTNGFPIVAGGSVSFKIPEDDPTEELWCLSDTASTDVRVYEGYRK